MAIRNYRPYTPGTRTRVVTDFSEVTGRKPERTLVVAKHRRKGRNNRGVITCRHRGGGHKRLYRVVDFRRNKHGVPAKVAAIHYDPHRNALLALLFYADGEKRYILAPAGVQVGQTVVSQDPMLRSKAAMPCRRPRFPSAPVFIALSSTPDAVARWSVQPVPALR